MKEYFRKAIEVEMQRFGLFFTLMIAAGGGSVSLFIGDLNAKKLFFALAGISITSISGLFAPRSYRRINSLLEEIKDA